MATVMTPSLSLAVQTSQPVMAEQNPTIVPTTAPVPLHLFQVMHIATGTTAQPMIHPFLSAVVLVAHRGTETYHKDIKISHGDTNVVESSSDTAHDDAVHCDGDSTDPQDLLLGGIFVDVSCVDVVGENVGDCDLFGGDGGGHSQKE